MRALVHTRRLGDLVPDVGAKIGYGGGDGFRIKRQGKNEAVLFVQLEQRLLSPHGVAGAAYLQ